MAISFVKKTPSGTTLSGGGAGTSTTALAFGSAVTAGNLIVVVLHRWREAAGTLAAATISDGAGNTWYKDSESINTRDGVTIWHCYANSAVAMSITAAFTDSAYWCISAYEFSGVASGLTAGASGNNTGSGSSTSPSAGAVSPSGNCLYIGGVEFDAAVTCTQATGWTLGGEDESWTYAAGAVEYRTGSGSQTASWTLGTSAKWAAAVAAYVEATETPTYTVTYNGNDNTSGTAPTDSNSPYDSGDTVTVIGNTGSLVRTGYTFNGWNTSSNGSGTHYDADDTFNISGNTVLYAEWEEQGIGTIGSGQDISVGTETIRMIIASNITGGITFPTGTSDSGTDTISRRFLIQETDFTNAMAVQVLQWAYNQSKFSSTVSDHNGLSSATVKWGGQELIDLDAGDGDYGVGIAYSAGVFSSKTGYANKPLVMVSWYGAVMLCNWLTEMKYGSTTNCVYTGIDTTWTADETVTDFTKTGYRLPTRVEYQYCARYRGTDSTNSVAGYTSPYYTQGDSASGATADYTNATATALVAVYGTSALANVKSKSVNALGLYDMTGNVWKWLENYTGNGAYDVGSCWERSGDQYLQIGVAASSNACSPGTWDVGFRMARTYTSLDIDGSISESLSISDSITSIATLLSSITESATISELCSSGAVLSDSVTETISAIESLSCAISMVASNSESASITDSSSAIAIFLSEVSETISIIDSLSSVIISLASLIESMTIEDFASSGSSIVSAMYDETATLSDSYSSVSSIISSIIESSTIEDSASFLGEIITALCEEVGSISDSLSVSLDAIASLIESSTIEDSSSTIHNLIAEVVETGNLVENISSILTTLATITESSTIVDTVSYESLRYYTQINALIEKYCITSNIRKRNIITANVSTYRVTANIKIM